MILLSFDIEEFDVPMEQGFELSLDQRIKISKIGTRRILDILKKNNVKATLFCTANFVIYASDLIKRAIDDGHEIACHGVDHWSPKQDDPKISKKIIEKKLGIKVYGYRQPRMFDVDDELIRECGYTYNSSLNPAFIPGKYMHLKESRIAFMKEGVLQIPASVSPHIRIPMFWLSYHLFPKKIYFAFAKQILNSTGYFMTYFHPWEFVDHPKEIRKNMLPIVTYNNGKTMCKRLDAFIKYFRKINQDFVPFNDLVLSYTDKVEV